MGHKTMDEMKHDDSIQELCDLKKDLVKLFSAELHSKGVDELNADDCGKVTDMIKDLAEAKKYCMEACYYESIVHAMEKAEKEEDEDDRMGYNNRRYASGRYAPKGRGHVMGFVPYDMDDGYISPYRYDPNRMDPMMGYSSNDRGANRSQSGNDRMGYGESDWNADPEMRDHDHSRTYNEYRRAKRHYTETKSQTDKQEMDDRGMRHVHEAIASFKDIWKDADPTMRANMKSAMTALVNDMK